MKAYSTEGIIGARIKWAREKAAINQAEMSDRLGLKDRQTLSAIETGGRKVTANELVKIMEITGRDLEFFTDPMRLVGEGRFSFRAKGLESSALEVFEESAGRWVAAWRELGRLQGIHASPLRPRLMLNEGSSYEQAQAAGEALVSEWNLGEIPASGLVKAIEEKLCVLVLFVDMPEGISGAACQLPPFDVILVNRRESEGRRNYDVAHEIFHVLTWDSLPPRYVDRENPGGYKDKRVEQLADNFAGALLMPAHAVSSHWQAKGDERDVHEWLNSTAEVFRVTAIALKWRMVALGLISKTELEQIQDEKLCRNGRAVAESFSLAPAYSCRYLDLFSKAIERGDLSVRRVVEILQLSGTGGLKELFAAHGLEVPFDL